MHASDKLISQRPDPGPVSVSESKIETESINWLNLAFRS